MVKLSKGLGQGCHLYPIPFNLFYTKDMMSDILEGKEGLRSKIRCIKFADDIVILPNATIALQRIIANLEEGVKEYGIKINMGKQMLLDFKTHRT